MLNAAEKHNDVTKDAITEIKKRMRQALKNQFSNKIIINFRKIIRSRLTGRDEEYLFKWLGYKKPSLDQNLMKHFPEI